MLAARHPRWPLESTDSQNFDGTTSPPARVANARHVASSIDSAMVRTEPSTRAACATPE